MFWRERLETTGISITCITGCMPFRSPNQHCQSTERHLKHWRVLNQRHTGLILLWLPPNFWVKGVCCFYTHSTSWYRTYNESNIDKPVLSYLTLWYCPHLPATAVAIDQYLLPAGPTAANLQQWACCCERRLGQTDGQTSYRFTDPAEGLHRILCGSASNQYYLWDISACYDLQAMLSIGKTAKDTRRPANDCISVSEHISISSQHWTSASTIHEWSTANA